MDIDKKEKIEVARGWFDGDFTDEQLLKIIDKCNEFHKRGYKDGMKGCRDLFLLYCDELCRVKQESK